MKIEPAHQGQLSPSWLKHKTPQVSCLPCRQRKKEVFFLSLCNNIRFAVYFAQQVAFRAACLSSSCGPN